MHLRETHIIGRQTHEWIIQTENCLPLRQHHIFLAGISDAAAPYAMVRLHPAHLHFLVCTEGGGFVLLDGKWQRCGAGQAYICPPGRLMAFHALPRRRWKFAWIYYGQPAAARLYPGGQCRLQKTDPWPFETAVRGLYEEIQSHGDETAVASWSHLLHTACLRLLKEPVSRRFRLKPLWQAVEGNPAYPWSMLLLSQKAGVSEEHLRRLSWEETGRSPMKHVAFLRMQRAALLLQTTQLKVVAVAEAAGYENAFAFSTAFKRHIGCSPSAFLAELDRAKQAPVDMPHESV